MSSIETPSRWTPNIAHRFAMTRVNRIRHALFEIAYLYGDVDETIVSQCDWTIAEIDALSEMLDEARDEGRTL